MKNCIFCEKKENIVFNTKNFYIKVGKGIITSGHCMIIPKDHINAIGDIDNSLIGEFLHLKLKLINFLSDFFYEPFIVEHGAVMQSVFHAHIHFIPLKGSNYKEVSLMNDMVLSFIKDNQQLSYEKINSFQELKNIYKKDHEYLYFEEGNKIIVIRTAENIRLMEKIKLNLSYRAFFSNKIGLSGISDWKLMTEQDLKNDNIKVKETVNKFKKFSDYYEQ